VLEQIPECVLTFTKWSDISIYSNGTIMPGKVGIYKVNTKSAWKISDVRLLFHVLS